MRLPQILRTNRKQLNNDLYSDKAVLLYFELYFYSKSKIEVIQNNEKYLQNIIFLLFSFNFKLVFKHILIKTKKK